MTAPRVSSGVEVDVVVADSEVRHDLEGAAGLVEKFGIDGDAGIGHDPRRPGRVAAGLDDEPPAEQFEAERR